MTDSIQGGPECIDIILEVVSDYYKIPVDAILMKTRKREVLLPRQICMTLSSMYTKASLAKIGMIIGSKDHATVLHAKRTIANLIDTDKIFQRAFNEIRQTTEIAIQNKIYNAELNVCLLCGSQNIISLFWVNINNNKIYQKADIESDVVLCLDCKSETQKISRKDYVNLKNNQHDIKEHTLETVSAGVQESNQREL